jgi:hypothetical protein
VAQRQWRQSYKQVANDLTPLDIAISLMLRGHGGTADAWLQSLWLAAATVVCDVLRQLWEEENSVGAHCHRDNDDAFVNVVWQRQRRRQFEDGNWATAIGWRWWDSDDVMTMGGQQQAERLQVMRHPSKATINYCGQFWEDETREMGNLGGQKLRNELSLNWLSGDWFPLNRFQINLPPTPERQTHKNLFRMRPRSTAALSVPW